MKKALAILLSLVMALSMFGVAAAAFDEVLVLCDHPDAEPVFKYDAGDGFPWINVENATDDAFKSYDYYYCYDCEYFLVYEGEELLGVLTEDSLADYGLVLVGDLNGGGVFFCDHVNTYPLPTEEPDDPALSWLDVSNATDEAFKNYEYEKCRTCGQITAFDDGREVWTYSPYTLESQYGIVYHEGILSSAILLFTEDVGTLNPGTYWFDLNGFLYWQSFINGVPSDALEDYQDASYYYNPAANAIIITRGDFCETWSYADDSRIFGFLRQVGVECSHLCAVPVPVGFQYCGSHEEYLILDNVTDPVYLTYRYYYCFECGDLLVYDGDERIAVPTYDELLDLGFAFGYASWHLDEDDDGLCDNCGGYRLTEDVSDERYYLVVPDEERTYLRFAEIWASEKDGETVFDMMLEGHWFGHDDDEGWESDYAILSGWITAPNVDPDQAAAAAVDAQIEAIGEVTLDSGEAIEAARSAYNALTDAQKALVNNIDMLIAAEETYADHVAAANVNALIEAIGTVEYTDACKAKIDNAKDAYDALTDVQKELVTNAEVLTEAIARYNELKAQAETPIDPTDPGNTTEPTDPDTPSGDNICKWDNVDHGTSFWGRLVKFFHSILYFFAHLFGRR